MARVDERRPSKNRLSKRRKQEIIRDDYFDYPTLFIIIVIVLFGVMMVYSSSSYRAVLEGESSIYYAKKQAMYGFLGILGMLFISKLDYKWLTRVSLGFMWLAIVLCGIVLVIGTASHGATRWIPIGSLQFQPSEIAKPILIVYMADVCVVQARRLETLKGIANISILPLLCIGLIAKENLSTAIVCFAIMYVIMFVASPNIKYMLLLAVFGVVSAILFVVTVGYRGDRFDAWFHPETSEHGFQTMQSLYAIGSGGIFGRGLGQSIQKLGFLPESHNDMIFSVVCEELGIFGATCVIALFLMLIMRFRYIASNARERFGGLLMTGIITHLAIQLFVNIGVVTNTIPPTGVTLPFISYGGTSLVFMLGEMGLALSVSRYMEPR